MTDEDLILKLSTKILYTDISKCWLWAAYKDRDGYGKITIRNWRGRGEANYKAHRLIFTLLKGDFDSSKFLCHTCDNPSCVNPDHLFIGTVKDNIKDMDLKGRRVVNNSHNKVTHIGNNYTSIAVVTNHKEYASYSEAGRDLGVSDNTIRNRIKRGTVGYFLK